MHVDALDAAARLPGVEVRAVDEIFDRRPERRIGDRVETGTWFMNRCDYLDPALAWTGVKDSGRGCTLSKLGLEAFTRPKSFHLRFDL